MTARYRITPRAEADLIAIARYTRDAWGEAQQAVYLAQLEDRFAWLAEHPKLGRQRPELNTAVRSFPEGSHLILYRERAGVVEIIGVAHKSMDIDDRYADDA